MVALLRRIGGVYIEQNTPEHSLLNTSLNSQNKAGEDFFEAIGLVKFDFLGLRTLTIIDWAVKAINARRREKAEPALDILDLPLDDKPTYKLLSRGLTTAVFQFESRG